MRVRTGLAIVAVAAIPLGVQAQPLTGLYIGAGGGLNMLQNEPDAFQNGIATPHKTLEFNAGGVGVASIGWGFGYGFRAELEGDYRYNGLSRSMNPMGGRTLAGAEEKYGPMVNLLYDFNSIGPTLVPYVGAGAGYQWAKVSASHSGQRLATGTEGALAYQAILGAATQIAAVPGLAVTTEYRFFGMNHDRPYSGGMVSTTIGRTDDFNHSLLIGLRYAFEAPPPTTAGPPISTPAPAPSRSYLVFFDWDKATLTARAKQIVKEAADGSTKVQYTKIEVNGYTDTSGTPKYNQGLSIRRAQAVAAELVKDGVPKGAIAIQGFGETHLLVPTGPGVREPQNRRVEIIIR